MSVYRIMTACVLWITDVALARLPALRLLWSLRIVTDEPIQPATIDHLKRTLPVLEYLHIRPASDLTQLRAKPSPRPQGQIRRSLPSRPPRQR
jgi:hypothetical protein